MIGYFKTRRQTLALFFVFVILFQTFSYTVAYALTSGPTQPEVQSFQPAGTTDMVDLFSGDFTYNIPLFELPGPNGGYPFNLSYQAGIGMDQEASWVGLGWSLQPGAITRQMRGLPDEFKGDNIRTKMSIDPSVTVGLGVGVGAEVFGGALELGLGFGVYQNSYKGMGYSIDANIGFSKAVGGGMTGGLSLGLSVDSKEGVGVNPSLSLGGKTGSFGIGAGYNSKQGLTNVSLSTSGPSSIEMKNAKGEKAKMESKTFGAASTGSATISFAHTGYTPRITMPMKNINLSATFKIGASWWGISPMAYVSGFYSEQWLANDKKWVDTKGYGYMNYQFAGPNDILDFNREKDGMVSKESPNLALPSLTYDIYNVTGQGIGMMYRPMRNDYGAVYDQETASTSNAIAVGVDVAPAATHIGVNLSLNHSKSTSGIWKSSNGNDALVKAAFGTKSANNVYEPWHFKVHGEATSETDQSLIKLGGDKAMRVRLSGLNISPHADATVESKSTSKTLNDPDQTRKPRTNAISSITNAELLNSSNQELLSYFKVKYIDNLGTEKDFVRATDVKEKHHYAGHTALTADGLRYVYAIPAYNITQEEVVFSTRKIAGEGRAKVNNTGGTDPEPDYRISGTDKFLKRTVTPKYAHSHLLTSILGPDYVDVLNDGVTSDDLGYWVKFTYKKTTTDAAPFKWRDPYSQAHFQEGWRSDPRDDKGSFVYGEKEMWYLARAETKSHVADFTIEVRDDGKGVNSKVQDDNLTKGASVYRLNNIKLYTRTGGSSNPIKITKFEYNYSLCPGIENSATNGGKLTLKKVWFEYGNSTRGSLNPYLFTYNNEATAPISYDINAYDRWGNYKPYPVGQKLFNQDFPYADQDPTKKAAIDANAAAWSLKEIVLPSGGKVMVDYETDDYAFVQNKTAMQMTSIVDPYSPSNGTLLNSYKLDRVQSKYLQVRFKLEKSLPSTTTGPEQEAEILKYIDTKTWQLYFKLLMSLRSPAEGFNEYITGYADIDKNRYDPQNPTVLLRGLLPDNLGNFAFGFITLVGEDGGSAGSGMHPFAMRAWQHLRTNQPELSNSGKKLEQASSDGAKIDQIKSMGGIGAQIRQMFDGFYKYCNDKSWGNWVTADKSWIRLNSPDKIKYGGGIRVKQITLLDQWSQDGEGKYGQVYDYTTTEGNSATSPTISSGVAAYEPIIGGDENALHYGKKYTQSIPMRSDNNMFFEYPVNESYYPGPQVGYSKVTVMSLPSAALAGKTVLNNMLLVPDGQPLFPTGTGVNYGTSGKTMHEFYTAKDFPVITDETEKANKHYKLSVTIPFLGSVTAVKLATSQGYSIVTNDMHGKQKKVSNFRQSSTGKFENDPMSWVQYNYRSKNEVHGGEKMAVLFNTLNDNGDGTLGLPTADASPKVDFGQEVEFFHDMREFEDNAWGGGARYNTDIMYIPIIYAVVPIPIPTIWPSISKSTTQLRTAVTNKVIFRSGILESVEAFDGGSLVITNNLKWDKLTGATVLTSVNNNFDDPVYSYTVPAYTEYQGMGAAYQNLGVTFEISAVQRDPYKTELYQFYPSTALPAGTLFPGDEILLYPTGNDFETPVTKVIYTGNVEEDDILYSEQALTATAYKCMVVRSGYRNQLNVSAGAISALQDPSVKKPVVTYSKTISVPK